MTTSWKNGSGEKKEVHAPILKVLIWILIFVMFITSLPLALLLWAFGFKGFFHDNEWAINKEAFQRKES